jgi:hypothetical protein
MGPSLKMNAFLGSGYTGQRDGLHRTTAPTHLLAKHSHGTKLNVGRLSVKKNWAELTALPIARIED